MWGAELGLAWCQHCPSPGLVFQLCLFPAGVPHLSASVSSFVQKGNQGAIKGAPPAWSHSSMPRAGRWEHWWFPPPGEGTLAPRAP